MNKLTNNPTDEYDDDKEEAAEEQQQEIFDDECEMPDDFIPQDVFILSTGGLFTEKDVYELDLPKFYLKNSLHKIQSIDEHSGVTIQFIADNSNPDIGKRLFQGIKEGIKEFKISFPDLYGNVVSTWELTDVKIKALDFGELQISREERRTIRCELEYSHFYIDGLSIT